MFEFFELLKKNTKIMKVWMWWNWTTKHTRVIHFSSHRYLAIFQHLSVINRSKKTLAATHLFLSFSHCYFSIVHNAFFSKKDYPPSVSQYQACRKRLFLQVCKMPVSAGVLLSHVGVHVSFMHFLRVKYFELKTRNTSPVYL